MDEMKREHSFIVGMGIIVCFMYWGLLNSCSLTTTWKPIERKEVSPYIERVMGELSDSCRIISIEGLEGKKIYKIECKDGAKELRNYLIKK